MEFELHIKGDPKEIQEAIAKLTGEQQASPWFQEHPIPMPAQPPVALEGDLRICTRCGGKFHWPSARRKTCNDCQREIKRGYQAKWYKKKQIQ